MTQEFIDKLIERISDKVAEKVAEQLMKQNWFQPTKKNPIYPSDIITVMYGVRTDDIIWNDASSQADTISTEISSANYKKE